MKNDFDYILQFLKNIAFQSGDIMKFYYNIEYKIFDKPDKSKVTEVDLKISELIQREIKEDFPDCLLCSEESNFQKIDKSKNIFIFDELDGTNFYIQKKENFAHCSAYIDKEQGLVIGLVYFPIKDILLTSIKNNGVYLTKNQITERLVNKQSKNFSTLKYSHPINYKGNKYNKLFNKLGIGQEQINISSGSVLFDLIFGICDVSISLHNNIPIWDIAPSKILLEELNYSFTLLNGDNIDFFKIPKHNSGYLICPKDNLSELLEFIRIYTNDF